MKHLKHYLCFKHSGLQHSDKSLSFKRHQVGRLEERKFNLPCDSCEEYSWDGDWRGLRSSIIMSPLIQSSPLNDKRHPRQEISLCIFVVLFLSTWIPNSLTLSLVSSLPFNFISKLVWKSSFCCFSAQSGNGLHCLMKCLALAELTEF